MVVSLKSDFMLYVLNTASDKYDANYYGPGNDLRGCVKDALGVKDILCYESGCEYVELFNENCTRGEVINNLRRFASIMKPGDTLLWYHSGHGSYQDTQSGRATCRCMHDQILWDYELPVEWRKFKAQVNIITISDTCFSQSNSRMAGHPLGGGYHAVRCLVLPKSVKVKPTTYPIPGRIAYCGLSACTDAQVSYENEGGGVFTQAFKVAVKEAGVTTWMKLLEEVKKGIAPEYNQTPVYEYSSGGAKIAKLPWAK